MTDACGNYKTNYTADVINLKAFLVSNRNKMQDFFFCFVFNVYQMVAGQLPQNFNASRWTIFFVNE